MVSVADDPRIENVVQVFGVPLLHVIKNRVDTAFLADIFFL